MGYKLVVFLHNRDYSHDFEYEDEAKQEFIKLLELYDGIVDGIKLYCITENKLTQYAYFRKDIWEVKG
jgi:hypothetical protein